MADYAGTKMGTMGVDKLQSSGRLPMIQGGPAESASHPGSGPTGSSRSYPKGGGVAMKPCDPMMDAKSTYGVNGV